MKLSLELISDITLYAGEILETNDLPELLIYPQETKKLSEEFEWKIVNLDKFINETIFHEIRTRIDNYRIKNDVN